MYIIYKKIKWYIELLIRIWKWNKCSIVLKLAFKRRTYLSNELNIIIKKWEFRLD